MRKTMMNVETGEVIDFVEISPFRSITDLKDYNDNEKSDLPSLTDPSLYESLDDIFKRCQRGELIAQKRALWSDRSEEELLETPLVDGDDLTVIDDIVDLADVLTERDSNVNLEAEKKAEKRAKEAEAASEEPPAPPPPEAA